jgi:hypothetical protein
MGSTMAAPSENGAAASPSTALGGVLSSKVPKSCVYLIFDNWK